MKLTHLAVIALVGIASGATALAQGGPGMGPGKGGRFAFGGDNTPGWALMTAEERDAHRQKMWSAKSYDECKAFQDEHHKEMEARAKEQGKTLPAPRANACERMQARGTFK